MRFSSVNWNLYRSFILTYEEGNLMAASKILGVTRPAVGQNIAELSKQLGVKLFIPHRRGVEPTSDANIFYPKIKEAMSILFEAEESLKDFDAETKTVLRIAVPSSIASVIMKDFFKMFCQKYPNVNFDFFEKTEIDIVQKNKIDLVIRFDYLLKNKGFKTTNFYKCKKYFVVSKEFYFNHNLSKKITKEQLMQLPLVIHKSFDDIVDIKPYMIVPTREMVVAMTQNGLGVGCVVGDYGIEDLIIIEVDGVDISKNLAIGYTPGYLTKAAKVFADELLAFFEV